MCNLDSVARAIQECGGTALVTSDPLDLGRCDRIVLPGVGAFPEAMRQLRERSLLDALVEEIRVAEAPFLGICLGMQLLADLGHEVTETKGLGWIAGEVARLEPLPGERVPHIGWNEVHLTRASQLFDGIPSGADFYFVHSYALRCDNEADVLGTTPFSGGFTSVVSRDNVSAVQFHPEKSQRHGLQLLRNFLAI
jgi:glutamine amidotransferase